MSRSASQLLGMSFLANMITFRPDFSPLPRSAWRRQLVAIHFLTAMVWLSIRAWTRKFWNFAGRIHFSLVAVAGLALLGWFYHSNLLGFHYNLRANT